MDVVSKEEHDRIVSELRGEIEALKARPEHNPEEMAALRAKLEEMERAQSERDAQAQRAIEEAQAVAAAQAEAAAVAEAEAAAATAAAAAVVAEVAAEEEAEEAAEASEEAEPEAESEGVIQIEPPEGEEVADAIEQRQRRGFFVF